MRIVPCPHCGCSIAVRWKTPPMPQPRVMVSKATAPTAAPTDDRSRVVAMLLRSGTLPLRDIYRSLRIPYNEAATLLEAMDADGIVHIVGWHGKCPRYALKPTAAPSGESVPH